MQYNVTSLKQLEKKWTTWYKAKLQMARRVCVKCSVNIWYEIPFQPSNAKPQR